MSGQYSIEKWSLPVRVGGVEVGRHHFLVLKDGNGKTVRELHGGAEEIGLDGQPTGNLKLTALSGTHLVKEGDVSKGVGKETYSRNPIASDPTADDYPNARWEVELQRGSQNDIMNRWNAAVDAAEEINSKKYNYLPTPNGSIYTGNSNSSSNTLAQVVSDVSYKPAPNDSTAPGASIDLLIPTDIMIDRCVPNRAIRWM